MVLQGGVMGRLPSTGHVAYVESVQRDARHPLVRRLRAELERHQDPTTRTIQVSSLPASGVDFIG